MATGLEKQTAPAPAAKFDSLVQQKLEQARRRILKIDLTAAFLVLLAAVLGYALVMALVDLPLRLPTAVRGAAFVGFLLVVLGYVGVVVYRLVRERVNPYYAACQLEKTVPGAKNSVVNWLDLRQQPLPPVILGALGKRAAKDVSTADLERALSPRRLLWYLGAVGVLVVLLLGMFVASPGQFSSLLQRALFPFEPVAIATRTEIILHKPAGGNATVQPGDNVPFRVEIRGRVPRVNEADSPRLHFRYQPQGEWSVKFLDQDADGEWIALLTHQQLRDGFWYKITAGDAETPEYRVAVDLPLLPRRYEVEFIHPDYLRPTHKTKRFTYRDGIGPVRPDLLAVPEGTQVKFTVIANHVLEHAQLDFIKGVPRELFVKPIPGDPEARLFEFFANQSGTFKVLLRSRGKTCIDPTGKPFELNVVKDELPEIRLLQPESDIDVPANGTLEVEGKAKDDHGLKGMSLHLQVVKGPSLATLQTRLYEQGKSFQFQDGSYPKELTYHEAVPLSELKTTDGKPLSLAAGMEIEFWLEATDNCTLHDPKGQVGESERRRLRISAEQDKDKVKRERQEAEARANERRKQQEEQLAKEDKKIGQQQQPKNGKGSDPKMDRRQQEDFQKEATDLQNRTQDQERRDNQGGEIRPDNQAGSKGEKKDKGPKQSGSTGGEGKDKNGSSPKEQPGQQKKGGKNGEGGEAGGAKPAGSPDPKADNQAGESRGEGQQGKNNPAGQAREQKQNGGSQSQAKDPGQSPEQAGASRDQGPKGMKEQTGAAREAGKGDAKKDPKKQQADRGGARGSGSASDRSEAGTSKGDGGDQKTAGQQTPGTNKTAPNEQTAGGARDQNSKSGPGEAGTSKSGPGQSGGAADPQGGGQVRGQEGQDRGTSKPGNPLTSADPNQQSGKVKGGDPKEASKVNRSENKTLPPDQVPEAGTSKPGTRTDTASAEKVDPRIREATKDDITRLNKELHDPKLQGEAARDLSRIRDHARDAEVKKAADETLKKAGFGKGTEGQTKSGPDSSDQTTTAAKKDAGKTDKGVKPPQQGEVKTSDPKQDTGAAKTGDPKQDDGQATDKQTSDPVDTAKAMRQLEELMKQMTPEMRKKLNISDQEWEKFLRQAREKIKQRSLSDQDWEKMMRQAWQGRTKDGTNLAGDKYKADPVDPRHDKRAFALQLEETLMKLQDPEFRKKLNISDEEWKAFEERAARYRESQREDSKLARPEKLHGGKSLLPNTGVRQVGSATDPTPREVEFGRGQPPIEFRDAMRNWTKRPKK